MTRLLVFAVALAACKGERHDAPVPTTGSAPAPTGARLQILGCTVADAPPTGVPASAAWTPYGGHVDAPVDRTTREQLGDAAQIAITPQLAALDACFGRRSGSARALLLLDDRGEVEGLRAGGLGDAAIDQCIAQTLAHVHVPTTRRVEVACDLERGNAQPWRLTTSAYHVISVSSAEIRNERSTLPSTLVLADPDAPIALVERALASATGSVILAVKAAGGPPVYVGPAAGGAPSELGILVDHGVVRTCVRGAPSAGTARVIDPDALEQLLDITHVKCGASCVTAVGTHGAGMIAKDLVAIYGAARRAHLHLVIGGAGDCAQNVAP